MDFLSKRIKEVGIISIILIIAFSLGLLVYIQSLTERDIKSNLLLQQKQRQTASTHDISLHIGSDLNLVVGMLDGLANSIYLQQGDFSSDNSKKLVGEKYTQFSKVIDSLFLLDKNNIVTLGFSPYKRIGCCQEISRSNFSLRKCLSGSSNSSIVVLEETSRQSIVKTVFAVTHLGKIGWIISL